MRRPPLLDLVLAGLGAAMTALAATFWFDYGPHPAYAAYAAIHAGLTGALLLRTRRPRFSFVATYALLALLAALYALTPVNLGITPLLLCAPLALASITRWAPAPWGITALLLGIAGSFASPAGTRDPAGRWYGVAMGAVALHILLLVLVYLWSSSRRRTALGHRAELDAQSAAYEDLLTIRETRAITGERERIAREIHDIVAHSLTVVQVQAATALALGDEEHMRSALQQISANSRAALDDVRSLVALLRVPDRPDIDGPPRADPAREPPVGDLTRIPALIADAERAGLRVDAAVPDADDLAALQRRWPAVTALSVLRVVQESLTNAVRHADPDQPVHLRLAIQGDTCLIDVTNTRPDKPAASPGSGLGLIGLRERLTLVDGTFSAGQEAVDGRPGFGVHATIPLPRTP